MRGARVSALLGALLLLRVLHPAPALAAFELRDASPLALGRASTDGAWFPPGEEEGAEGWSAGACRAALYAADGLSHDQLDAAFAGSRFTARIGCMAVSGPGSRESSARLDLLERAALPVSVGVRLEGLRFAPDEGERWKGFAAGFLGRAALGRRLEAWVGVDRLLRSVSLGRAGVPASLELGVAVRAKNARLTLLDRGEPDGSLAARIALEIPLGPGARLQLARPDRAGSRARSAPRATRRARHDRGA